MLEFICEGIYLQIFVVFFCTKFESRMNLTHETCDRWDLKLIYVTFWKFSRIYRILYGVTPALPRQPDKGIRLSVKLAWSETGCTDRTRFMIRYPWQSKVNVL